MTSMSSILESKLRTKVKLSPTSEEIVPPRDDSSPAQPAPITLMPLPLVPSHDNPSGDLGGQSEAVYADPADCIRSATPKPIQTSALYVDPASVLPLLPPCSRESITPESPDTPPCLTVSSPESVYSEVYDKVCPVQNKPLVTEPIYTLPTSGTEGLSQKKETKPDPFAHLYAQVCKKAPSSSSSSSSNSNPSYSASSSSVTDSVTAANVSDESLDDVIYENLGII